MTIERPRCFNCKHFDLEALNCSAYPDQIPEEILSDEVRHDKKRADQKGDAIYEPINPQQDAERK